MTKAELEKRVAELQAENARLRPMADAWLGHVCGMVPMAAEVCNCASGVTSAAPCPVHRPWPQRVWITAAANGAADQGLGNVVINTAGCCGGGGGYGPAQHFTVGTGIPANTQGCAGGGASQTYTVAIPAG